MGEKRLRRGWEKVANRWKKVRRGWKELVKGLEEVRRNQTWNFVFLQVNGCQGAGKSRLGCRAVGGITALARNPSGSGRSGTEVSRCALLVCRCRASLCFWNCVQVTCCLVQYVFRFVEKSWEELRRGEKRVEKELRKSWEDSKHRCHSRRQNLSVIGIHLPISYGNFRHSPCASFTCIPMTGMM